MANGAGNTRKMVPAPPVTPSPYGLFSAATVLDDAGTEALRWVQAGLTWEPAYCGPAHETVAKCEDAAAAAALAVDDGINAVESSAFTAYHLFRCRLPGRLWETGDERAAEALRLGEQRAAEIHMERQLATATSLVVLDSNTVHAVEGLGRLERYLGANYGGTGVVHADPLTATVLESHGVLERVGITQQAKVTGTRIAVGGGYGDTLAPGSLSAGVPAVPAAGTAWLYATGQVMVRRRTEPDVMRSAAGSLTANEYVALAERPYVIGWECVTAAIRVRTTYGVPT